MSIQVLKFSCGGKRIVNSTDFIGKEIILWLSGIKPHKDFNKCVKYLNCYGENIYFKKIMPVNVRQWDMYMYSIINLIVFDYRYLPELVKFNEMIGGDERVDKAIANSNKFYNPMCPLEDYKKLYVWRPVKIGDMYMYNYEWSVTKNNGFIYYWICKLRKVDGTDGADGTDGTDGADGADGADGDSDVD